MGGGAHSARSFETAAESSLGARLLPFAWLAAALGTAALAGLVVALIAGPLAGARASDALDTLRPFARFVEFEFEDATAARTRSAATAVRERRPNAHVATFGAPDGTAQHLLVLDDASTNELIHDVRTVATSQGLTVGGFSMGSGFALMFEALVRDPADGARALAALFPTLLLVGSVVFLVFGAVLTRRESRRTRAVSPSLSLAARVGLGLALGILLLVLLQVASALMAALGAPIVEQTWLADARATGGTTWVAVALVVAVVAPLGEELLFRGYLLRALAARWSPAFGLVVSTIAFAAVHGHLAALAAYLLYGAGLGLATLRTRSVVPAVVAHTAVNTTAVLLLAGGS